MSNLSSNLEREAEWAALFADLTALLSQHGKHDHFGEGDFLVVDDDYGLRQQKVEFTSSKLVRSSAMQETHQLLASRYRAWEVIFVLPRSIGGPAAFVVTAAGVSSAPPSGDDA
jgi:hypothetical protein